jgi:hypothetical protein
MARRVNMAMGMQRKPCRCGALMAQHGSPDCLGSRQISEITWVFNVTEKCNGGDGERVIVTEKGEAYAAPSGVRCLSV